MVGVVNSEVMSMVGSVVNGDALAMLSHVMVGDLRKWRCMEKRMMMWVIDYTYS